MSVPLPYGSRRAVAQAQVELLGFGQWPVLEHEARVRPCCQRHTCVPVSGQVRLFNL
jgi:hypothetical protein